MKLSRSYLSKKNLNYKIISFSSNTSLFFLNVIFIVLDEITNDRKRNQKKRKKDK